MKGYSKLKRTTSLLMILVMVLCMMPQNLYAKVSNTGLNSSDLKQLVTMNSLDNVVALGSESDPDITALKSPVINQDGTVTFNYVGTGSESMIVKGEFNSWTPVPMELNTTSQGNSYFSKTVQVATGAGIYTYGMEDTSAASNGWKADPLNPAVKLSNTNPAIVRNPIVGSSGTTIYYPATVPGAKVYYRVAGSSDPYQNVDMTADATFKSGMYSYTFTVAGDYEYYIQDEKGNNIGDPNNFVSTSDPKTFKVATVDPEVANLTSPIVNGTQVTFNYYAPSANAVKVAGSFTSWADKAITLTKNAKGIWTTTQTLQPGSYQYKFVVDGSSWVTDPKNSVIKDTNSAFNVDGLVVSTKVDVEKGKTATLPTTASMYTNGVSSQVTVDSYSLVNQTAGVIITGNTISVDQSFAGDKIDVVAKVGSSEATFTVYVVSKVYTYNYYYYRADGNYSDKDLWVWSDGVDGSYHVFTDTYTDAQGRVWGKGTLKFANPKITFIARTTDAAHSAWNGKDLQRDFTMLTGQESTDIWIVYGDTNVYTTIPGAIAVPDQRYVVLKYLREDKAYTDWNVYTWTDSTRVIDFDKDGYAIVPVESKTEQLDFVIRKGYPKDGETWVKDGSDCSVSIPTSQTVAKAIITSGATSKPQMIPWNKGYECDVNNHVIKFYYRDDTMFKAGTLDTLVSVEVEVAGVKYPMTYSKENERYEYTYSNPKSGNYEYSYFVLKTANDQKVEVLDKFNASKQNGKSVLEYRDLDATVTASVSNTSISSRENVVLSVLAKSNDVKFALVAKEVYVDLSSLGGKSKVSVEPDLMAISIGVTDSTTLGVKQIPVTVIDQFGKTYNTTVSINVVSKASSGNDFDWDEAVIYFMLTDRFFDGNASNNDAYGVGDYNKDPKTGCSSYHGGDFAGVTAKLDYLKDLGINTIWISPIVDNITDDQKDSKTGISTYGYHGYWARNFEALNKHLGTEQELTTLISEAHKRGIKIMVDVVLNHAGYGTETAFASLLRDKNVDGNTILGSLAGLPDFATEKEAVRNQLIDWQTAWVKGYGIDYFRVDTVKHVETTTWAAFKNALTKINPNFKMIGEYAGAGISNDFGYLNTGKMDSLLNFDFNDMAESFVTGKLVDIEKQLEATNDKINNTGTVGNFLGSHDEDGLMARLQTTKSVEDSKNLMKIAATLQMTAKGQPVIYYGEELGQTGLNNWPYQTNRYDLDWSSANDSNSMYTHYKKLLKIRNDFTKVFAKGTRKTVDGSDAAGYLLVEREFNNQKVLVAFNLNNQEKEVSVTLSGVSGKTVTDVYNNVSYKQDASGKITLKIPAVQNGGTAIIPYSLVNDTNGASTNNGNTNGTTATVSNSNELTLTVTNGNWSNVVTSIKDQLSKVDASKKNGFTVTFELKDSSVIPVEVFNQIKGTDVTLNFVIGNNTWTVKGSNIKVDELDKFAKTNKALDLTMSEIKDKDVLNIMNSALTTADSTITMLAAFETKYSGALPFTIQLQVKVDSKLAGKVLFVSRWNEDTKKYQPLGYEPASKSGAVDIYIDHFSKYVVTLENPALPTQITKKSVYAGKKFNIQSKITNLLYGDKVFYYSSKKSVASVSESGVITAKKAGTVTITTKVIQNGKAYVYKTKVTVKNPVAK